MPIDIIGDEKLARCLLILRLILIYDWQELVIDSVAGDGDCLIDRVFVLVLIIVYVDGELDHMMIPLLTLFISLFILSFILYRCYIKCL